MASVGACDMTVGAEVPSHEHAALSCAARPRQGSTASPALGRGSADERWGVRGVKEIIRADCWTLG
jgi:hypothetical protein